MGEEWVDIRHITSEEPFEEYASGYGRFGFRFTGLINHQDARGGISLHGFRSAAMWSMVCSLGRIFFLVLRLGSDHRFSQMRNICHNQREVGKRVAYNSLAIASDKNAGHDFRG